MSILFAVLGFALCMGLLIFVHEYGHYKVGRIFGVKAKKFSIGFGPVLYRWIDKNGCQWQLASIPMGGYVAFYDERVEALCKEDIPYAFNQKTSWQKFLIVLAGPMTNLVFAILAFWALNLMGVQSVRPMMGPVLENSIAAKGGFENHMTITSINGASVTTMEQVSGELLKAAIDKSVLRMEAQSASGSDVKSVALDFKGFDVGASSSDLMGAIGFVMPGSVQRPLVDKVFEGSVAKQAGIKEGSLIVSVNGDPLTYWSDFRALMLKHYNPKEPVSIALLDKEGVAYEVKALALKDESGYPKVGIQMNSALSKEEQDKWIVHRQPSVVQALGLAVQKSYDVTIITFKAIKGMLFGPDSTKGISGPVGIAENAGRALEIGWKSFFSFMGFVSLSLFLMNMLPIPVLDGGHLVQYTIEGIRGKSWSEQTQRRLAGIGFSILMCLMFIAIFNDIERLF